MRLALIVILTTALAVVAQTKDGTGRAINVVPRKAGASTWVIAVGVDRYVHVPLLKYAGADSLALAKAFRDVARLERSQVLLINDDSADRPDAATLARLIPEWLRKAGPDDTVVFHFSGHGFRDAAGELYLAPLDFDPARPAATGLAAKTLRDHLRTCKAAAKLILLDACHSGAFTGERQIDAGGLAETFGKLEGAVSIASSSGQLPSHELHGLKQGIFTHWLVRGLRGEANSTIDGVIDADELYRFLNTKVPETAKRELKVEQKPYRSFEQLAGIPTVLELKNPDRPSDLVAPIGLPFLPEMPSDAQLDSALVALESFPRADSARSVGVTKWIIVKATPGTDVARRAEEHLRRLDQMILKGELPRPGTNPRRDDD